MEASILKSTKVALQIPAEQTAFDQQIIMHINSVLSTLTQIGIGPADGFMVEDDDATWDTLLGSDRRLSAVKSYIYMKVKMLFDPPGTSFHISALEKLITEAEWRLNLDRENALFTAPKEI